MYSVLISALGQTCVEINVLNYRDFMEVTIDKHNTGKHRESAEAMVRKLRNRTLNMSGTPHYLHLFTVFIL
jgi:hypothetical protein